MSFTRLAGIHLILQLMEYEIANILISGSLNRSANSSSAVRFSPRVKARNPTPRLLRFNASSLLSAYNTNVAVLLSSADSKNVSKMLL